MFDTSSRTCVLPLAASKLYAENHVGRLHTQHGSPFARLRTRVLDRREKWTSFVSCSSRQPSHQHIVSGFQERDTIAAGTSSRGDPFACRARSAGLPQHMVAAAGGPATRPSRRARLRDLLEGRRRPPRDDHSGAFHIMTVRRVSAPLFLPCCLNHRHPRHAQQQ